MSSRRVDDVPELVALGVTQSNLDAVELARLINGAVQRGGRGWCSTSPLTIARYLIDAGVQLPDTEPAKG